MSKPNKDGWIRHRGGKCPVDLGTLVDIRNRDGKIFERVKASNENNWVHHSTLSLSDVMSYRLHKPEQAISDDAVIDLCVACADEEMPAAKYFDGPIQWRDRIREIDSTVESLEEERVSLVQKLEAEGFRLIDPVKAEVETEAVLPAEDMSDWRNWKK